MTLNQLVDDILNTCNYIDPKKAEPILRRHVEAWINQYRLVVIDRDINKNSIINPSYISYMDFETNENDEETSFSGLNKYKTVKELPRIPNLTGRIGITSIMFKDTGEDIDLKDISRAVFATYNKFSKHMPFASIIENKIIIFSEKNLRKGKGAIYYGPLLRCGLILSDPADIYSDPYDEQKIFFKDMEYPMPHDKIWLLKQLIFAHELEWIKPGALQTYQNRQQDEQSMENQPKQLTQGNAHLYEE